MRYLVEYESLRFGEDRQGVRTPTDPWKLQRWFFDNENRMEKTIKNVLKPNKKVQNIKKFQLVELV